VDVNRHDHVIVNEITLTVHRALKLIVPVLDGWQGEARRRLTPRDSKHRPRADREARPVMPRLSAPRLF